MPVVRVVPVPEGGRVAFEYSGGSARVGGQGMVGLASAWRVVHKTHFFEQTSFYTGTKFRVPQGGKMRVNVYAEELTDRFEIVTKEIDGTMFTGVRIYLELPATVVGKSYKGPFIHRPGDDDSSAVTFWSTKPDELRDLSREG